jgi:hypothetical protein
MSSSVRFIVGSEGRFSTVEKGLMPEGMIRIEKMHTPWMVDGANFIED